MNGFEINADQNKKSFAFACNYHWVHPENTGNLTINRLSSRLYFAGGDDSSFKCLDVEVWGLH